MRNQDDELNLRICRAGGRIWQSPRIVSWYQPRPSLGRLSRQYFQYGYWKVAVIRKHKLPASWRHLAPAVFVLMVLLLGWFSAALWEAMVGTYMLVCCAASFTCGRRHGWMLVPALPAVFVAYHFSYGLGFLAGLALWPFSPVPVFTRVTR